MKNSESHNFTNRITTGVTLVLFVAGIALFSWPQLTKWWGSSNAESVSGRLDAQLVSSRVDVGRNSKNELAPAAMTRSIEKLRVGDRVLAYNPEVSQAERDGFVEPVWSAWLQLSLSMPKPDGSLLEIELLRPEAWVREQMRLVVESAKSKTIDESILSPLAPSSGRGVGGEGQTDASSAIEFDLTTKGFTDHKDLVPYSPLRPIFRDLAFASAELEISGDELQAIFVEMNLPELAITGPAIVHEIRNAPPVKPGAGRVITATFHHSSGDVIDLVVGDAIPNSSTPNVARAPSEDESSREPTALAAGGPEDSGSHRHDLSKAHRSAPSNIGSQAGFERTALRSPAASAVGSQSTDQVRESDTIGTTSNHPFWSVDRQEYVQAGQLAIGERLQTYSGDTKRVVSKLARPGPQPVYNLEVFAEHVYYVGKDGLLVHNAYDDFKNAVTRHATMNASSEPKIRWAHRLLREGIRDGDSTIYRSYMANHFGIESPQQLSAITRAFNKRGHGNQIGSQLTTLYAKFRDGVFQKFGITLHSDPRLRYSGLDEILDEVPELRTGPRSDMVRRERRLVERFPGPENNEPWAGIRNPNHPNYRP